MPAAKLLIFLVLPEKIVLPEENNLILVLPDGGKTTNFDQFAADSQLSFGPHFSGFAAGGKFHILYSNCWDVRPSRSQLDNNRYMHVVIDYY